MHGGWGSGSHVSWVEENREELRSSTCAMGQQPGETRLQVAEGVSEASVVTWAGGADRGGRNQWVTEPSSNI